MRKVEEQLSQAIKECRPFSGGNTVYSPEAGTVTLHGNLIARISLIHPERSSFSWAGWITPTTRSRLNACYDALFTATERGGGFFIENGEGKFFITTPFGDRKRSMDSECFYSVEELCSKEVSNA